MYSAEDLDDLRENIMLLVDDYLVLNIGQYIYPHFHENLVKDVTGIVFATLKYSYEDINDVIQQSVETGVALFYKHIAPPRSNGPTFIRQKPIVNKMRTKIAYLQSVPQPEQRTPEWYQFRYNHLTASNIWKAFISESTRNQLIFEKCQPLNTEKFNYVSLESPMHWGQKYESVSIALYEHIYEAKVSDFGCIPHRTLEFLAASPDGIVTDENSLRYGRMLEVKNIVNREITGIPKMEYWIQMQVQMEVCELNECDFIETRFTEYTDKEAFEADTLNGQYKGAMMLFMTNTGKPIYEYAPLFSDVDSWQEIVMEKNNNLNWVKNIYWKLDQLSCVLVLRNKFWFKAILPELKDIWLTIENEKKQGYTHRGPKKNNIKVKKLNSNEFDHISLSMSHPQCFINTENLQYSI